MLCENVDCLPLSNTVLMEPTIKPLSTSEAKIKSSPTTVPDEVAVLSEARVALGNLFNDLRNEFF